MSYDVSLEMDTGAGNTVPAGWWNMTSNVAPMWREAGADLAEMRGWPARHCVEPLTEAIDAMVADPAKYRAMNPDNGWGDYEGCLEFLRKIRDACQNHPDTTFEVSR